MWGAVGNLAGTLGQAWIAKSDRRLKRNIKPVGELRSGLTVYEFNYLDDPETLYTGLMADEVFEVMPHHVGADGGYLTVDYGGVLEEEMRDG